MRRLCAALVIVVVGLSVSSGESAASVSGPTVALARYELRIGEAVRMTIGGFRARSVVVAFCGNEARRGSSDCNMAQSDGWVLNDDGSTTVAETLVREPPVPCPCVLRIVSNDNDEIAIADITLIGHPSGPVEDGEPQVFDPLTASLAVDPADQGVFGWLRSSLGGSRPYDVTITIRNAGPVEVRDIETAGWLGRSADDVLRDLDPPTPEVLGPGATWSETFRAELPAPAYGGYEWRLDVMSDAPTLTRTASTSHLPGVLIVVIALLALDAIVIAVRLVRRRTRWESRVPGPMRDGAAHESLA